MSIHSKAAFDIVQPRAFKRHMKKYVPKWIAYLESEQRLDCEIRKYAVEMAFADVMRYHPECIRLTAVLTVEKMNSVRMDSAFGAMNAPSVFRAMFAEA